MAATIRRRDVYDANGQLKTVTNAAGSASQSYDRAGQKIETTDANGIKTAYTYDAAGRMLTRTVDPTGLNLTTKTFFDGGGQAIWQQDANGIWTQMQYNADGELVSIVVDPLNVPNTTSTQTAITLIANSTGVNLRTEYTYDSAGNTLTVTEGVGSSQPKVTQYSYDVLGRRTQEAVDPERPQPAHDLHVRSQRQRRGEDRCRRRGHTLCVQRRE